MNQIQNYKFNGKDVRMMLINNEPYFVGKDVASILGYKDLNRAVNQHVDEEDRKFLSRKGSGDSYITLWSKNDWAKKVIINESGLYSLILSSKLPDAKKFKHWVTSKVLPSIRKTGSYNVKQDTPSYQIADSIERAKAWIKEETVRRNQAKQLEAEKPKVDYYESQMNNPGLITTSEIAKNYGWSAQKLNKYLATKQIQFKRGSTWMIYQKYQGKGLAALQQYSDTDNKYLFSSLHWTAKGRKFIYDLLKKDGIKPLVETQAEHKTYQLP